MVEKQKTVPIIIGTVIITMNYGSILIMYSAWFQRTYQRYVSGKTLIGR